MGIGIASIALFAGYARTVAELENATVVGNPRTHYAACVGWVPSKNREEVLIVAPDGRVVSSRTVHRDSKLLGIDEKNRPVIKQVRAVGQYNPRVLGDLRIEETDEDNDRLSGSINGTIPWFHVHNCYPLPDGKSIAGVRGGEYDRIHVFSGNGWDDHRIVKLTYREAGRLWYGLDYSIVAVGTEEVCLYLGGAEFSEDLIKALP